MKRFIACTVFIVTIIAGAPARAQAPTHVWSHLYGSSSDQYGQSIAVDTDGNVIVAGTFWSSIDLGGGPLTSAGMTDVFLARFDATGAHAWSHRFGDSGLQNASGGADAFVASFSALPARVTSRTPITPDIEVHPNPFNPAATIHFTVPSKGRVTLAIYDSHGSRVATLVDDERSAGAYTWTWHGVDDHGRQASSGVYFARVTHARGTNGCKMILLK
jgi:hypothetical protein